MPIILVVDDNYDNRFIAGQMLSLNGYTVLQATDGADALEVLHRHVPDLILMDLTMPRIDGWETTRRIKASQATAHIPIVALTSHAVDEDLQRALDAGCADYLIKPYEYPVLLAKVKAFLRAA